MEKFKNHKNTVLLHLIDEFLEHVDNKNDEFLADLYNIVIWEIKSNDCFHSLLKNYSLIVDNSEENIMDYLDIGYIRLIHIENAVKQGKYTCKDEYLTVYCNDVISSDTFFQENDIFCKDVISTLCYGMNSINQEEALTALTNILHTFTKEMKFA